MNKWSFNSLLFSRLPDVLDISGAEIARRCGMKQQVFNRYTNQEVMLSVQILMTICNSLRMPIHFFVSEENNHVIPNRECATIPLDEWHPIEWNHDAVEKTFGDGGGRIYWKDVAEAMDVTEQKPHDRFKLKTRFPIDGFLTTCNKLNISPFLFLIDNNRDKAKRRATKKATVPAGSSTKDRSVALQSPAGEASLRADVAALTKKLDGMNTTIAELTAKYDDLLQRHTALLERHNRLERDFSDYTGYNRIGMAAEPETDET